MNKSYRGSYERRVDQLIADQAPEIEINWINMSAKEAGSGGADRATKKLIEAGYRPDGSEVVEKVREAYKAGKKVDGRYIRLLQEIWRRRNKEDEYEGQA